MVDRTFDVSIILGLSDKASEKFKTIEGRSEAVTKGFQKAGAALTAFAVAGGAAILSLTNKASDLEETASKFNVVFAGQVELAETWSKELVKSYGVSTLGAKRFLSTVQDLLVPMGLQKKEAAKLSNEIVKLSVDLGSFNNLPTEQVMGDIQSALTGMVIPMKKYGVVLNQARIEQEAMNLDLFSGKGQIDASAKAQAVYNLIVADSSAALGDFIRTSKGYANQTKIMEARIEDLKVKLGEKLLPVMTDIVGLISEATKFLQDMSPEVFELAAKFLLVSTALAAILGPMALFVGFLPQIIIGIKQISFAVKFATTGIAGWTVAIGAAFLAANALVKILDTWYDRVNRLNAAKARDLRTTEGKIKAQEELKEKNIELFQLEEISQTEMFERNKRIDSAIAKLRERARVRATSDIEDISMKSQIAGEEEVRLLEAALQTKIEMRQINIQDAINAINKELEIANLSNEKRKALEKSLTDFQNKQLNERLNKIKSFAGSVEGAFANQIGMMIHATQTFGGAVQGVLDAIGTAMVEMIAKEAAVWITAQIAKATAGALAAHSGIPFVGIALGLAAAGAIVAEINKAKAEANLATGGIVTSPITANLGENYKREAVIPLQSPAATRALAGAGIGGKTFIIQNNIFAGPGGLDDLVDIIEGKILGRVQDERTV